MGNKLCGFAVIAAVLASPLLRAEPSADLGSAIAGGKLNLSTRLRYEGVQQDNAAKDADAVTVRTRLGYRTADWNALSAFVEMQSTSALLDHYAPATAGYSTVADPEVSDVSQWGLRFAGLPGLQATMGRSRLILDNARWVGNVGWRQNEQTFDGAFLTYTGIDSLTAQYDYLSNVNTITGTKSDLKAHLLNLRWSACPALTLTAYAYLLDYIPAAASDVDTYGLRATGSTPVGDAVKLLYTAEYAAQKASAPGVDHQARYLLAEVGLGLKPASLQLGYEVLGSDDGTYGLRTDLATKHAFQGWADVFLATPATGIRDASATIKGKAGPVALLAAYHDFRSDDPAPGLRHYGSEVDVQAGMALIGKLSGLVKGASYSADDFGVDTKKLWLQLEYSL